MTVTYNKTTYSSFEFFNCLISTIVLSPILDMAISRNVCQFWNVGQVFALRIIYVLLSETYD